MHKIHAYWSKTTDETVTVPARLRPGTIGSPFHTHGTHMPRQPKPHQSDPAAWCQLNAQVELQHIELELRNGRAQHMRSFVDQYYCYKNGHMNSRGRASWDVVVWKGLVSVEARELGDRKQVVKEHLVPIRVITKMLTALAASPEFSLESIATTLDRYVRFATISKREDRLLRQHGFNSAMPEEFRDDCSVAEDDLLCRYRAVGIALEASSAG